MSNDKHVVTDAVGVIANVGDTVVFAPGQKGAQPFIKGVVTKVTEKTVTITYERLSIHWKWKSKEVIKFDETVRRNSGCFMVIQEECDESGE